MAILKCKMCGGELDIIDDSNVVECEYCGSKQTIPDVDDEKKLRLYDRANKLRMACDYDKAAGVYESIVAEFPDEAEAYWGLILCKYGIEYVDDPATGKKIPTCHRSSFDSVMEDSNFDMVMENADAIATRVYREEAKQFEEIRKRIVEISNTAEDYDIFICYKETAEDGDRTIDSVIAQDVYDALTSKGYKVFFARVSLEDKLGQEYEPYIFSALNTSEVMLVFGTDYEYFNAVWVKNEWSRFLKLMEKDPKKSLIPCYKNIDAYDMPKEFARLQAQDMGKVGAVQDLIRGIEKLIGSKTVSETKIEVVHNDVDPRATALVKRGYLSLEDENEEYEAAKDYFDQALNYDAENAEAYLGLFLVEVMEVSLEKYDDNKEYEFSHLIPCKRNIEKSEKVSEAITKYSIPGMVKSSVIEYKFEYDLSYESYVESIQECIDEYNTNFNNKNWKNANKFAKGELKDKLQMVEHNIIDYLEQKLDLAKQDDEKKVAEIKEKYDAFIEEKYQEIEKQYANMDKIRQADYENACELMDTAKDARDYKNATDKFKALGDYKDCNARSAKCERTYNRMLDEQRRKEEYAARERQKKEKKKKILTVALVVAVIACIFLTSNIIKGVKYKNALKMRESGDYQSACDEFIELKNYKDSDVQVLETKYLHALNLRENKDFDKAVSLFVELDDYKDSTDQVKKTKYDNAMNLKETGDYDAAYKIFVSLADYSDSDQQAIDSKYCKAIAGINEGDSIEDYMEAYNELIRIGEFKDATTYAAKAMAAIVNCCNVGEGIYFGNSESVWIILEKSDNKALLLSADCNTRMAYNDYSGNTTWANCTLRQWLNSDYYNEMFGDIEKKMILETKLENSDNSKYGTSGGSDTTDKVFLLSIEEANKYFNSDEERSGLGLWWLRSPGENQEMVAYVLGGGNIDESGRFADNDHAMVHPAIWIDLNP